MTRRTAIIIVLVFLLVMLSCAGEDDIAYATLTVHNDSDYEVTLIRVLKPNDSYTIMQGTDRTFDLKWAPGGAMRYSIQYYIGDDHFDVEHMEGALYYEQGEFYYSPYSIKDGAKAFVNIYNDGYKLEMIGGEYSILDLNPPPVPKG